jgi:uncharacterized YigZ family protein
VEDTYKTIQSEAQGLFKDKGSRFLAFAYPVVDENQIKETVAKLRRKYHDARHICYAFHIGFREVYYRVNDDGEPSGTAGRPILGQITANNLTNILIVVVRYFGGVLLGTPGLINAYRSAAADCIHNAKLIEKTIDVNFEIQFKYEELSRIMKIVKEEPVEIMNQVLELNCIMNLRVRQSCYDRVKNKMLRIDSLIIQVKDFVNRF